MKWMVTWWCIIMIPTECPDYKPNPYTGEYPAIHCLVLHQKEERRDFTKYFYTKKEAEDFIRNAPDDIKPNMTLKKVYGEEKI